jgi:hypothetical protein
MFSQNCANERPRPTQPNPPLRPILRLQISIINRLRSSRFEYSLQFTAFAKYSLPKQNEFCIKKSTYPTTTKIDVTHRRTSTPSRGRSPFRNRL